MRDSLRKKIFLSVKFQYPVWVNGGEIERLTMADGKKASNGSRRARELVDDGYFERRLNGKRCVEYKYKPIVVKEKTEEQEVKILAQMGIFG